MEGSSTVPIFVRAYESSFLLHVSLDAPLESLAGVIQQKTGVPPDLQSLCYGGKPLRRSSTLRDVGVSREATIHLFPPLMGGSGGETPAPSGQPCSAPNPGVGGVPGTRLISVDLPNGKQLSVEVGTRDSAKEVRAKVMAAMKRARLTPAAGFAANSHPTPAPPIAAEPRANASGVVAEHAPKMAADAEETPEAARARYVSIISDAISKLIGREVSPLPGPPPPVHMTRGQRQGGRNESSGQRIFAR